MALLDRRAAIAGLTAAAHVFAGCAFELRAIVVDDAPAPDITAPDAPAPDVALDLATPDAAPDAAPDATFDAPPDAPLDATPDAPPDMAPLDVAPDVSADVAPDVPVDVAPDVPSTRAGAPCTNPDPMGGVDRASCGAALRCLPTESTPACSLDCFDSASQSVERAMCGGGSSTCLTLGDRPDEESFCALACDPAARPGAPGSCRAGFVCTGWWFTHASGRADAPGCAGFCARDADCPAGLRCNTREGLCGTRLPDPTRLPDGSPCDPTVTELPPGETFRRNTQCRGMCLDAADFSPHQGICGSYLDLAVSSSCPDDPARVLPLTGPDPDNLALCVERSCARNADCRAPLVCRYDEDPSGAPDLSSPTTCLYPTPSQRWGIP